MADDNVNVIISAQIEGLLAGVEGAKDAIESLTSPLSGVISHFKEAGEAIIAAFAIERIERFMESMEQLGIQTQRASVLLGEPIGHISALDVTAKAAGSTLESLTMSMERLGLSLAKAEGGSKLAQAGLDALGVSAKGFQSLSTEQKIALLADKFAVLRDGIDKDAIAMAIFGRGGAALIPVLNQGSHALEEFAEIAHRAGSEATQSFIDRTEDMHLKSIELSKSLEGLGITMTGIFGSTMSGAEKILIDLVQDLNKAAQSGGSLHGVFIVLSGTVQIIETAFVGLIQTVKQLWAVLNLAADGLTTFAITAGKAISSLVTGHWADAKQAVAKFPEEMKKGWDTYRAAVRTSNQEAAAELESIWTRSAKTHEKIVQDKNRRLKIADQDAVNAAMLAEQQKIKNADAAYNLAKERINTDYQLHVITEGQKTSALLAALETRHQAEEAAVAAELAIHGLSKANYQKVLNEKLQLDQKYVLERTKILDAAMKEEAKTWNTWLSGLTSSFNGQLRGLLQGATSWAQAWKAIQLDMVIFAIQQFDKMAVEWAAGQLAKLTVAVSTEAGVTAAASAGSAARSTISFTEILKNISADIGKVFSGASAFFSTFLGPAAPAAAAGEAAAVEASAMGYMQFDDGTDLVRRSGFAMIHEGEAIVPAKANKGYTGGAGGGRSPSLTVNVKSMDGMDAVRVFKRQSRAMYLGLQREGRRMNQRRSLQDMIGPRAS